MGSSVKFVSTIIDAFPNKKGGEICLLKKKKPGVGGGFVLKTHFSRHPFLGQLPKCSSQYILLKGG